MKLIGQSRMIIFFWLASRLSLQIYEMIREGDSNLIKLISIFLSTGVCIDSMTLDTSARRSFSSFFSHSRCLDISRIVSVSQSINDRCHLYLYQVEKFRHFFESVPVYFSCFWFIELIILELENRNLEKKNPFSKKWKKKVFKVSKKIPMNWLNEQRMTATVN